MRQIKIEVYDDKRVKVNNSNLGDKGDNKITQLNFIFDKCTFNKDLIYNYFAYRLRPNKEYKLVNITENKSIILDYEFMKTAGTYDCLFILSDKELNYFTNDKTNFVSDTFYLYITNNYLDINNLDIKENKEGL